MFIEIKIQYSRKFIRHHSKRILLSRKLSKKFDQQIELFIQNPNNPQLKDHKLTGTKKHLRSFSITGDIRLVYQKINKKHIILHDIGTHSQVY